MFREKIVLGYDLHWNNLCETVPRKERVRDILEQSTEDIERPWQDKPLEACIHQRHRKPVKKTQMYNSDSGKAAQSNENCGTYTNMSRFCVLGVKDYESSSYERSFRRWTGHISWRRLETHRDSRLWLSRCKVFDNEAHKRNHNRAAGNANPDWERWYLHNHKHGTGRIPNP